MSPQVTTIVISLLGSSVITALVTAYFNRKKTDGEALIANNTGEKMASDDWREFGLQAKRDKEELRTEFLTKIEQMAKAHTAEIAALTLRINQIQEEKDAIAKESQLKDGRITVLERQVVELQKEISKYKGMDTSVEHVTEVIHSAVDAVAEQIKSDNLVAQNEK